MAAARGTGGKNCRPGRRHLSEALGRLRRSLLASASWPTAPFPCDASLWPGPRCRAWEQGSNQALLSAQLLVRKAGPDGDLAEK